MYIACSIHVIHTDTCIWCMYVHCTMHTLFVGACTHYVYTCLYMFIHIVHALCTIHILLIHTSDMCTCTHVHCVHTCMCVYMNLCHMCFAVPHKYSSTRNSSQRCCSVPPYMGEYSGLGGWHGDANMTFVQRVFISVLCGIFIMMILY